MNEAAILLANAAALGFRHGIDWDHMAAIADIVGTTCGTEAGCRRRALALATLYALGHASVVTILGIAALCFSAVLPAWMDPIMQRVVGATLLILGVWVFYSLIGYLRGDSEFKLQSRWMLAYALIKSLWEKAGIQGSSQGSGQSVSGRYRERTAFGVGMLHGIGAETGTQVLVLAAIGGAASHGLGLGMLAAFIAGLVASNTALALAGASGFACAGRVAPLYIAAATTAGCFSLGVGSYLITGHAVPQLVPS